MLNNNKEVSFEDVVKRDFWNWKEVVINEDDFDGDFDDEEMFSCFKEDYSSGLEMMEL